MPATSRKQQQFFGIVRAIQKGKLPLSAASASAQRAAKRMQPQDVTAFSSTKHTGLPVKAPDPKKAHASRLLTATILTKRADVQAALAKAEKAIQQTQSTQRKVLTDNLKNLRKEKESLQAENENLQQQVREAQMQSQQMEGAMNALPPDAPSAQPPYGNMLTQQGQGEEQEEKKIPQITKLPGQAPIPKPVM